MRWVACLMGAFGGGWAAGWFQWYPFHGRLMPGLMLVALGILLADALRGRR